MSRATASASGTGILAWIRDAFGVNTGRVEPDPGRAAEPQTATLVFDSNNPKAGTSSLRTDSIVAGDNRGTPAADGHHSIWNFDGGDIALSAYPETIGSRASWTVFGQVLTTEPQPTTLMLHLGEVMEVRIVTTTAGEFVLRRVRGDDVTLVLLLKSGDVTVGPLLSEQPRHPAGRAPSSGPTETSEP